RSMSAASSSPSRDLAGRREHVEETHGDIPDSRVLAELGDDGSFEVRDGGGSIREEVCASRAAPLLVDDPELRHEPRNPGDGRSRALGRLPVLIQCAGELEFDLKIRMLSHGLLSL